MRTLFLHVFLRYKRNWLECVCTLALQDRTSTSRHGQATELDSSLTMMSQDTGLSPARCQAATRWNGRPCTSSLRDKVAAAELNAVVLHGYMALKWQKKRAQDDFTAPCGLDCSSAADLNSANSNTESTQ
ncbi:unnamed protein product [Phytophthora lilii]|uniref:Unnamed protein product n=1 Tax=Phytophthora lilii TaxID=2077276 RepID=A0A9W6X552_9STRA|nr:unnamed protein product [Phytophthora lilii]